VRNRSAVRRYGSTESSLSPDAVCQNGEVPHLGAFILELNNIQCLIIYCSYRQCSFSIGLFCSIVRVRLEEVAEV